MLIPHSMTAKLLTGITALAALIGSLHFLRKLPRHKPESFETAFAVMMLVTAITAPHFYYYDLTMLILPAAIFASQTTREKFSRVQWAPVLLIAAAMFGSALIEQVGLATNVALGPILLIAAIVSALRRSTA